MTTAPVRERVLDQRVVGLSAARMAQGVRSGRIDPVALITEHLERIRRVDTKVGAFTTVRRDEALREAHELSRRSDLSALPLAGVPLAVKENLDVAGVPTTQGSRATSRIPAVADDEVVQRLRRAGCIVIGKTNMPELAIWPFSEGLDGVTRNPHNLSRTAGGSSGGSAAAVAAGMAALAIASDGGGSVRIPAACCGIVGVKTTPGLVPLPGGAESHWYGCSVIGPLARSTGDAALMLDALAGTSRFADAKPVRSTLRVSVSARHPMAGAPVSAEVRAAVDIAGDLLRGAGHDVAPAHPPYPAFPDAFVRCYLGGIADDAEALQLDVTQVEARTRGMIRAGAWLRDHVSMRNAEDYPAALRLRSWMQERDVLVVPVLAAPPVRVARWRGAGWVRTGLGAARWMGFAPPWNLAGCPAVTLPVMRGRNRLPVAVQLVGPPRTESTLLSVAAQLEPLLRFS